MNNRDQRILDFNAIAQTTAQTASILCVFPVDFKQKRNCSYSSHCGTLLLMRLEPFQSKTRKFNVHFRFSLRVSF